MIPQSDSRHEIRFYKALDLSGTERDHSLDEVCGGNVELRTKVDELLLDGDQARIKEAERSPG